MFSERLGVAAALLATAWLLGLCWRSLLASQRLALRDAFELGERRGSSALLLPLGGVRAV